MCQDNSGGEDGIIFSTNGAGTIGYTHKKWTWGPLSHILYQNELKMDHRHKCKSLNYKTLGERNTSFQLWVRQSLLGYDTKNISNESKNR